MPPPPDLVDLMSLYARRGILDWKNAPTELRRRAAFCLGTNIADNEAEAVITINTRYSPATSKQLKFIPMPRHPAKGIERCFFLPIQESAAGGNIKAAFELFVLVARRDCLAFRFEPAHAKNSTHGYGHVQLSRKMLRKTIEVKGVPEWLPDSYPAFSIATSDPLMMFLSMTTAVHGYANGVVTVLQDVFLKASRAKDATIYIKELNHILQ